MISWLVGSWIPMFLHFTYYTGLLQKLRKHKEPPVEILSMETWKSFFKIVEISETLDVHFFAFWALEMLIIRNGKILKSWQVEDEEWLDINFPLLKSKKVWMWISFRSKNMKRKFVKFSILGQGDPYHQSIPTPAPDFC